MSGRTFELQRELGDGAFGTVYLADLVSMGGFRKSVALKLLKPDWDTASDAARRLRDEARLLGRLRHRHIVQVDDLVRLDGRWAVVMEYVEGVDLERLISEFPRRPIPAAAAAEMVSAVAQALDAAWNGAGPDGQPLRVVHRDIKPSNIRLSGHGEIKVLDFGIARADFQGREARTDRIRYGSMGYMSPERLLGDPEVPAGDVFAIGAVFYELLTGQAFGRVKLGEEAAQAMLDTRLADADARLPAGCGPALDLVRACMAYEVDQRPETAGLATSLRALSRILPGEDLYTWSRQVLPVLLAETPTAPQITSGKRVLTEQLDSQTFILNEERAPSPTLAVESATAPASTTMAVSVPASSSRRSWPLAVSALTALLVLAIPAGFAFQALQAEPAPTDPPPSTVRVAAPLPPPPVEPEPLAELVPEPVAEPVPEPVAQALPTPTQPREPAPPKPPSTAPVTPPPETAPPPAAVATVDRVKFHVPGATQVEARCGDVRRSSTTASVNLSRIPAGTCSVKATIDGAEHSAQVQVSSPNGFTCQPGAGGLTCTSQL